jgi:hypothetical protein
MRDHDEAVDKAVRALTWKGNTEPRPLTAFVAAIDHALAHPVELTDELEPYLPRGQSVSKLIATLPAIRKRIIEEETYHG